MRVRRDPTSARSRVARGSPEHARACTLTLNYGEAGALQQLGGPYRLPPVISGQNTYWIWGPGTCSGKVLVTVGWAQADLAKTYGSITLAATVTCRYCEPEENDIPVYVVRDPMVSAPTVWPTVRHYG